MIIKMSDKMDLNNNESIDKNNDKNDYDSFSMSDSKTEDSMSDIESNIFIYRIIDYGCYLYKAIVEIDNKIISVYQPGKNIPDDMKEELSSYTNLIFQSSYVNIFIGKSPIKNDYKLQNCQYQGEYNSHYDGNTILIETGNDDNEYVLIGGTIFSFKSISKIDYYLSPIEYNESPYPYGLDQEKNIYLFNTGIIISLSDDIFKQIDNFSSPYKFMIEVKPPINEIKPKLFTDYYQLNRK